MHLENFFEKKIANTSVFLATVLNSNDLLNSRDFTATATETLFPDAIAYLH